MFLTYSSVKIRKPWTLEIFTECYCVSSKKPITREKTKQQTVTVISLWLSDQLKCSRFLDSHSTCNRQLNSLTVYTRMTRLYMYKSNIHLFHVRMKAIQNASYLYYQPVCLMFLAFCKETPPFPEKNNCLPNNINTTKSLLTTCKLTLENSGYHYMNNGMVVQIWYNTCI